MTPTIYSFTRALLAPADHFDALRDARIPTGPDGRPRMSRTSRFAEAEIDWRGGRWLVCMPLVLSAVPGIERAAARLRTLRSEWLAEYRLLRDEMRYEDSAGGEHRSDLVLQRLPEGLTFGEALAAEPKERLAAALEALRGELARLGISHGNLKPENLRWSGGRWLPIRWHHVRTEPGGDEEAFAQLLGAVGEAADGPQRTLSDVQAAYGMPADRLTGHLWVGHVFEQLVCVGDEEGFGYVDAENRTVIPAQYLWADDFHEGRAAVQTAEGMGLIDKQGRYVIPPVCEIVEYRPEASLSEVRRAGMWYIYDYEGNPVAGPAGTRDEAYALAGKEPEN